MNISPEFEKTYPEQANLMKKLIAENANFKAQQVKYQRRISDLEKQIPPKSIPIHKPSLIKPINQRKNSF